MPSKKLFLPSAKSALVDGALEGTALGPPQEPNVYELSIDEMLKTSLKQIHRLLEGIKGEIGTSKFNRNTVMNLRDCVAMLQDLREKEVEVLKSLSSEDLEKIVNE